MIASLVVLDNVGKETWPSGVSVAGTDGSHCVFTGHRLHKGMKMCVHVSMQSLKAEGRKCLRKYLQCIKIITLMLILCHSSEILENPTSFLFKSLSSLTLSNEGPRLQCSSKAR